jgi:glycosyltransferase involved in cell wall biosynthesis
VKILNILWVVDHLGFGGLMHGASKYYLNTIPCFDGHKFNVSLCVLRRSDHLTKEFEEKGIKVIHLSRGKLDPLTLFDLIKLIRDSNIDLIHTHGYGSDNFGRIVGKLLRIPTIIHAHDENSNYPWHQKLADLFLKQYTIKAIAISEAVKESCIKTRKIDKNKLYVLLNGIPLENFTTLDTKLVSETKKNYAIKPDVKIIGTVARMREEKGLKYLIQAASKILEIFPNTIFLIAGDGPLRNELENLSKHFGIDSKIIFAGFCKDIPSILSIMDIFVAPSVSEGLGLGIIEAMTMGKSIVASNVGGIKEILKDNETGLFVPPKDHITLADKVIYLLKNEKKAKSLSVQAREESKKYDIKLHVKKIEDIYFGLIK